MRSAALLALLAAGCTTPLSNRIAVGEDAFVIGVGEGPDQATDLYAAPAAGGTFLRLTFNRPEEFLPRLAPAGTAVAFFRRAAAGDSAPWSVVVLDLRTNDERVAALPAGAGAPERLGWRRDGTRLVVRAGGLFTLDLAAGAELTPVPEAEAASADSLTRELLGAPAFATLVPCGSGLCVATHGDSVTPLAEAATDGIRWGADSVGYFTARGFEVRPLSSGRSRRPVWQGAPARLRQLTYHRGAPPSR